MPRKTIGKFSVDYLQVLDERGKVDKPLMPSLTQNDIREIYKWMVLTRMFDDRCLKLQRQGRIGTFAPVMGQEASNIASAYALQKEDWIFPSFRENGSMALHGVPWHMILQYWGWDERGMNYPPEVNVAPISIPVGTHPLHAVGYAWGLKLQHKKGVVMVYFGDGATSEGDFHEAMNWAGVFKLPVIFVCQNNQWAISLPREQQTASPTLAQKAIAYGFEGVQVDGNDAFAVFSACSEAVKRARNGEGPTFIECLTYRLSDHTTADDAKRYRKQEDVEAWKKKDPIERLRKYMLENEIWTINDENKLLKWAEQQIDAAVERYESMPQPQPDEAFKYTFSKITWNLQEQMEESLGRTKNVEASKA
jgi:pyruvate dehydrogenase E1 component alpha subunit